MKALIGALALVFLVAAASPQDVARVVLTDGYFIEDGADATDQVVGNAVFDARASGGLLSVVVLAEEPSAGATTFADAVFNFVAEGTILVVAPVTVGWSSDGEDWTEEELNRALDRSLDGSTSDDIVEIFVSELVAPSSSGGGGLGILVVIGLIAAVGIAFFAWRSSKANKARLARIMGDLRAKAGAQVEDVANDILELESEVRDAADRTINEHFQAASQIYSAATDALEHADSPQDIVAVSAKLDDAIWNLDAVEALLDGNPVPPKPEPPKANEAPAPSASRPPASSDSSGQPPLTPYRRRESRRSSFGAGDILAAVLASGALRTRGRRGPTGGFGGGIGGFGRGSSRSTGGGMRGGGGRIRGGGRRRG